MEKRKIKGLILALLSLGFPVTLFSADKFDSKKLSSYLNNEFSVICIEEQSVGFNWEGNKWVKSNFSERKYTIRKVKISSDIKSVGECSDKYNRNLNDEVRLEWGRSQGCYNVKDFESLWWPGNGELCNEFWSNQNGTYKLDAVICPDGNFSFQPNGAFYHANIESSLGQQAENKDSMILSVGKCSILEGNPTGK